MRQNPHVRICGGPGSATTLVYPTASTLFVALIALVLTLLGQTCSSSADLSSASGISQPGDAAAPVDPGLESSSGESPSVTFPSTEGAQPTPQEAR